MFKNKLLFVFLIHSTWESTAHVCLALCEHDFWTHVQFEHVSELGLFNISVEEHYRMRQGAVLKNGHDLTGWCSKQ